MALNNELTADVLRDAMSKFAARLAAGKTKDLELLFKHLVTHNKSVQISGGEDGQPIVIRWNDKD